MCPNIKFWTRQEWIAANSDHVADLDEGVNTGTRGQTRAAQGINVNMRYIEDRDGQPVNRHLASDIRRHARAVFVGLAQKGHLFTSWAEADYDSLKTYYREMVQRFKELRFCSNDWKAEMVALDIYRTWRDQWQKRERKRKQTSKKSKNDQFEDDKDGNESDHSDEEVSVKHSINHGTSDNERATKKSKVDNHVSDANVAISYTNPAAEMQPKVFHLIVIITVYSSMTFYWLACPSNYQQHAGSPSPSGCYKSKPRTCSDPISELSTCSDRFPLRTPATAGTNHFNGHLM